MQEKAYYPTTTVDVPNRLDVGIMTLSRCKHQLGLSIRLIPVDSGPLCAMLVEME